MKNCFGTGIRRTVLVQVNEELFWYRHKKDCFGTGKLRTVLVQVSYECFGTGIRRTMQ